MSARVLMIADRDFATREHALLERVEHGVREAGHVVARAAPTGVKVWDAGALSMMIAYDDATGFLRPFSAPGAILEELQLDREDDIFSGSSPIDLVHAWGPGAYRVALEIARECQVGLVFDLSSELASQKLRKLRRGVQELTRDTSTQACVLAADETLADRAESCLPESDVRTLGWGVPATAARAPRVGSAPKSISVMCTGHSRRDVVHALSAISAVRETHENIIVFLDEQALDSNASIHRHVESLGLEDCLSVIGNMESVRELILESDVLIAPDTRHEHRSLILEAIASGLSVVVGEGCFVSAEAGEDPPCVVSRGDIASLREAIRACLDGGEHSQALANRAESFSRDRHSVSAHHRGILKAYESVIGAASVPIGTG